jgi:hypothetical protein
MVVRRGRRTRGHLEMFYRIAAPAARNRRGKTTRGSEELSPVVVMLLGFEEGKVTNRGARPCCEVPGTMLLGPIPSSQGKTP